MTAGSTARCAPARRWPARYNLPAVELANRLGRRQPASHLLREAGFTSLDRSAEYYGLGLVARQRRRDPARAGQRLSRARRAAGVWRPGTGGAAAPGEPAEPGRRVVSAARRRAGARHPGRSGGADSRLRARHAARFPFPVAAKTGTSRHFTDNWAVGATGRFTVAVWVGNFSGRPMDGVSGVSGAGPLLHRAVLLTADSPSAGHAAYPAAAGAVPVTICRLSGLLATPRCPAAVEWFAPGTAPGRRAIGTAPMGLRCRLSSPSGRRRRGRPSGRAWRRHHRPAIRPWRAAGWPDPLAPGRATSTGFRPVSRPGSHRGAPSRGCRGPYTPLVRRRAAACRRALGARARAASHPARSTPRATRRRWRSRWSEAVSSPPAPESSAPPQGAARHDGGLVASR